VAKIVLDIETDGLLDTVTRMHLMVLKNIDSGEIYDYVEGDLGWMGILSDENNEVIGHNIVGFDANVLRKLFGFEIKGKVLDTLLYSQILDYNRFDLKGHSLEVWGEFLGFPKGKFDDWTKYSEEMRVYCENDVELGERVYKYLMIEFETKKFKLPLIKAEMLEEYLKVEHIASNWIARAEVHGFPFNVVEGRKLLQVLKAEMDNATNKLNSVLGSRTVAKDLSKGEVPWKDPKWTKEGRYSANTADWFGVNPWSGHPGETRMIEGPYSRVEFRPLSIESSDDVKLFLSRHGWIPTEWNSVKDKVTGKRRKTSPKVTEDSLELLGGDGKLYLDFMVARSRNGVLKTWLENIDSQGRVHGSAMNIGTPSMRCRHSGIVNIPSVEAAFGKEMRALFHVPEGWKLIGCDSAGNQARGLAHFLKNDEYTNILLNDDIHTFNALMLTNVLKSMGIDHEVKRATAKRVLYATLFGASGTKLWLYIFGTNDPKKGKLLKEGFLKAIPGFDLLVKRLEKIFKSNYRDGKSFFLSIAGNRIYVDSPHKLLVYLLQSTEKITCSSSLATIVEKLEEENIEYIPLIYMHDEVQFMVKEKDAVRAAEIGIEGFREGPKKFGITIMDGSSKIGMNWEETH